MAEALIRQQLLQFLCKDLSAANVSSRLRPAQIHVVDDPSVVDGRDINLFVANVDDGHVGPLEAVLRGNAAVDQAQRGRLCLLEDVPRNGLAVGARPLRRRHQHDGCVVIRRGEQAVDVVQEGEKSIHVDNAATYTTQESNRR